MTQIPSGWYDDPKGSGQLRYWDGIAWTAHLRPKPDPLAMPAPVGVPAAGVPAPYGTIPQSTVDPYSMATPAGGTGGQMVTTQGSPRVMGIFLIVFGIVFTLGSLGSIVPAVFTSLIFGGFSSAGPGAVETTGKVVDLQSQGSDCAPVASFTVDGVQYLAISEVTYSPCNTAIGRTVTVSYLPTDIAGSAIVADDPTFTNVVSGAFIVGAIIGTLIGVALIWGGVALMRRYPK